MAESVTRRRRTASLVVFMVAAGALIATSPPPIPRSTLVESFRAVARVTSDAPRVTGVLTLELNMEALPLADGGRLRLAGRISISVGRQGATLEVRPVGVSGEPTPSGDPPSWAIETLCRAGEPCRRSFEVTVEMPGTVSPEGLDIGIDATVEIEYVEVDAVPAGATARWSASPELAPVPEPS